MSPSGHLGLSMSYPSPPLLSLGLEEPAFASFLHLVIASICLHILGHITIEEKKVYLQKMLLNNLIMRKRR